MQDAVKVIAKTEVSNGIRSVALFFPEVSANPGSISCWAPIGQHSEAGMGYFWSLRNPTDQEAEQTIQQYEKNYDCRCIRICRDSQQMRLSRWKLHC